MEETPLESPPTPLLTEKPTETTINDAKSEDTIVIEKSAKPKKKPKSPVEKIQCLRCGVPVRKYDLKRHETMYCNAPPTPAPAPPPPSVPEEEPAPKPKAKVKAKAKPKLKPDASSYPKEQPDTNELLMQLFHHINNKPKDNREDRYKRMMSQYYKI